MIRPSQYFPVSGHCYKCYCSLPSIPHEGKIKEWHFQGYCSKDCAIDDLIDEILHKPEGVPKRVVRAILAKVLYEKD